MYKSTVYFSSTNIGNFIMYKPTVYFSSTNAGNSIMYKTRVYFSSTNTGNSVMYKLTVYFSSTNAGNSVMYKPTVYFSGTDIGIMFDTFSTANIQIANSAYCDDQLPGCKAPLLLISLTLAPDCRKLDFSQKYYYETKYHLISLRLRLK